MLQHGVANKDTSVMVTGIERMCVCTLRPWAPLKSTCRGSPNEGRMKDVWRAGANELENISKKIKEG